jgi:hypothetical protein
MTEMLRANAPKRAPRASLYLMILVAGILAPYQAAQAISYWTAQGIQYFSYTIGGYRYDPVTDVYIYSESAAPNTKGEPRVSSPCGAGKWSYEFVEKGHDGRRLPKGGMRFFTDGKGLANNESAVFSFTATTDGETKWLFDFYDTATKRWTIGAVAKPIEPTSSSASEPLKSLELTPSSASEPPKPIEPAPSSASEPPKSGREFLLILILLAFAYWFYNDRRKKRGPSDNGPDIK